MGDGFSTPLLKQFSEELAETFPEIFKKFPLRDAWAYNYDDAVQQGIKVRGDDAAVNCNLWVTPNDANLDKTNGGLVVYTTPVPLHYDFNDFNTAKGDAKMQALIKDSGVIKIPYRQNRIVLFKSDLLHSTDKFNFKKGFL